jgi:hypothetical protein
LTGRTVRSVAARSVIGLLTYAVLGFGAALGATSCSSCDDFATAALNVKVLDAASKAICDASVIARLDQREFILEPTDDCWFSGAWDQPGQFDVTAITNTGESGSVTVVVERQGCHVNAELVTVVVV